mgnify:CR=1 FL=1
MSIWKKGTVSIGFLPIDLTNYYNEDGEYKKGKERAPAREAKAKARLCLPCACTTDARQEIAATISPGHFVHCSLCVAVGQQQQQQVCAAMEVGSPAAKEKARDKDNSHHVSCKSRAAAAAAAAAAANASPGSHATDIAGHSVKRRVPLHPWLTRGITHGVASEQRAVTRRTHPQCSSSSRQR